MNHADQTTPFGARNVEMLTYDAAMQPSTKVDAPEVVCALPVLRAIRWARDAVDDACDRAGDAALEGL